MNRLIFINSTTGKRFILDSVSAVTIGLLDAETGRKCRVWFTRTLDILLVVQKCFCPQPDLGQLTAADVEQLKLSSETLNFYFNQFTPYGRLAVDLTPSQKQQLTHNTIRLIEPVPAEPRQLLIRNGQPVAILDEKKGFFVLDFAN